MRSFLQKYDVLTACQNKFRDKKTADIILEFSEQLVENLEDNVGSVCTLIDLIKAFDTIDDKILLKNCKFYGLRGKIIDNLRSYLENREQYVFHNNSISDTKTIYYGVRHCSVLGPLLFLLYNNSLPNVCWHNKILLFADDCSLYKTTE